jgi:hypothetical protein
MNARQKTGIWLAGTGVVFLGTYLIQAVTADHKAPLWPYFLFTAVLLAGVLVFSAQPVGTSAQRVGMLVWSALPGRASTKRAPSTDPGEKSVATDRWRYTSVASDVSPLDNIGNEGFSHPSYVRQYQNKPPAVRVGMFVACSPLGDAEPTKAELQSRFQTLLDGSKPGRLISLLTVIGSRKWQSRPGSGRFKLESDLRGQDASKVVPAASAVLLLPDGDRKGAELILHIDLPMKDGVPVQVSLSTWHQRFAAALAVPAELARYLEDLGLKANDPATRFAIQVQARTVSPEGMEEIVDTSVFAPISQARFFPQFDGWAVADPNGITASEISKEFLRELCKGMGRTVAEGFLFGLPA